MPVGLFWSGSDVRFPQAYRYQRLLWPMPVACLHVHPAEQRPPVEREEHLLPLWLAVCDVIACCGRMTCPRGRMTSVLVSVLQRSLPVLHFIITHYNSPCGSGPETPPPRGSAGARHSHMTLARAASKSCSFPPGTVYSARLPKNLDLRRIGFVLLQPASGHASGSAPLPDSQGRSSSGPPGPDVAAPAVSLATTEKIQLHFRTLVGLRRRLGGGSEAGPSPPNGSGEDEEEQSEVCLALSESSSSDGGLELEGPAGAEPDWQQKPAGDGAEEEEEADDAPRQQEEQLFAQEYLLRVRAAVLHRRLGRALLRRLLASRCARRCTGAQMLLSSSCGPWTASRRRRRPRRLCTAA